MKQEQIIAVEAIMNKIILCSTHFEESQLTAIRTILMEKYATQHTEDVGEGWISVEEQPEKGEWYLVHIDRMGCGRPNIIDVCMYDSPQVWLRVDGDIPNDWKVTHYQPLPEPPKNSEDGNNLPNHGIDMQQLNKLLAFSNRYEINIQFWPNQVAVYIAKDGVDLVDFGGSCNFAINKAIEYLDRINKPYTTRRKEDNRKW